MHRAAPGNQIRGPNSQKNGAHFPDRAAPRNQISGPNLQKHGAHFPGPILITTLPGGRDFATGKWSPFFSTRRTANPQPPDTPARFWGCSMHHLPVHLVHRELLLHKATPQLNSTSMPPSLKPSPGTPAASGVLKSKASLHSNCLLHDDCRCWVDALLYILNVHPCLQSTVDSEALGLDDGLAHLRVRLIHHQVCLPFLNICSSPPVPQVCLQLFFARSIAAPSPLAASNILNGGGRLAVLHANQHSGDAPLRLPELHRATLPLPPSAPLPSLNLFGQSTHFGIVLRVPFL